MLQELGGVRAPLRVTLLLGEPGALDLLGGEPGCPERGLYCACGEPRGSCAALALAGAGPTTPLAPGSAFMRRARPNSSSSTTPAAATSSTTVSDTIPRACRGRRGARCAAAAPAAALSARRRRRGAPLAPPRAIVRLS